MTVAYPIGMLAIGLLALFFAILTLIQHDYRYVGKLQKAREKVEKATEDLVKLPVEITEENIEQRKNLLYKHKEAMREWQHYWDLFNRKKQ